MGKNWWKLIKEWTDHSGKVYEIGAEIGISDAQAKRFAEQGYVEHPDVEKKAKKTTKFEKVEVKKTKEDK